MTFLFFLLTFYSYAVEFFKNIYDFFARIYNDVEMLVLDGTFVQVVYYDYYTRQKRVVFDNSSVAKVLYLVLLKYVFRRNISGRTSLGNAKISPDEFTDYFVGWGILEVVYYHDRKEMRFFTKSLVLDEKGLLEQMHNTTHKKFLCATVSDQCEITEFVNDHLTSFNENNRITFNDLYNILTLQAHGHLPPNWGVSGAYLKLIDDDTIEETVYSGENVIVLT